MTSKYLLKTVFAVYLLICLLSQHTNAILAPPGGIDPGRPNWNYPVVGRPPHGTVDAVTVSFPGTFGPYLSPFAAVNDPGAPSVQANEILENGERTGVYSLSLPDLPVGSYQFRAAVVRPGDSSKMDEFGEGSRYEGDPITFAIVESGEEVTLYYDRGDNGVSSSKHIMPVIVGDFTEAAGYGPINSVTNLACWMKNVRTDNPNVFQTKLFVPQGVWRFGVEFLHGPTDTFSFARFAGTPFQYVLRIENPSGLAVTFVYNNDKRSLVDSVNGPSIPLTNSPLVEYIDPRRPNFVVGQTRHINYIPTTNVTVSFPGNFLASGAHWEPAAPEALATGPDRYGFYRLDLPAGGIVNDGAEFKEFKVAIDKSWNANYGKFAVYKGLNVQLKPGPDETLFLYDRTTNFLTCTKSLFPVLVGDFFAAAQYGNNWDSSNIGGWLQSFGGDNVHSVSLYIPAGVWQYRIAQYGVPITSVVGSSVAADSVGIGGSPFPVTLVLNSPTTVVFAYDHESRSLFDSVNRRIKPTGVPILSTSPDSTRSSTWFLSQPRPTSLSVSETVSFPGSFNGNNANDVNVRGDDSDGDGVYVIALNTIPGISNTDYTYRVALDGSLSIGNFGQFGVSSGNDLTVTRSPGSDVRLLFDRHHNFPASSNDLIPVVVGSFMSVAGYGSDWDPTNLNGWMKNFAGDQTYSTQLFLPAGTYMYRIGFYQESLQDKSIGVAGTPHSFSLVVSIDQPVTFLYDDVSKSVSDSINGMFEAPERYPITEPESVLAIPFSEVDNPRPVSFTPTTYTFSFSGDGAPTGSILGTASGTSGIHKSVVQILPGDTITITVVEVPAAQTTIDLGEDSGVRQTDGPVQVDVWFDEHTKRIQAFMWNEPDVKVVAHAPILVSDFMTEIGIGGSESNWNPGNFGCWMQPRAHPEANQYSILLEIPAGTWHYAIAPWTPNTQDGIIGIGAPIANSGLPVLLDLAIPTNVTFLYNSESGIVGDSVNGMVPSECEVECLNGAKCKRIVCECPDQYTGPRCEIRAHYDSSCLSNLENVIRQSEPLTQAYEACGNVCEDGFHGRECTLPTHYLSSGPGCQDGWYGSNCQVRKPIAGGSSMQLNLGQVANPWTVAAKRPSSFAAFPVRVQGSLTGDEGGWADYWGCKKGGPDGAQDNLDPFKWMRTIETWIYLPQSTEQVETENSKAVDDSIGYINIFKYCTIEYSLLYNGQGSFKLALDFGPELHIPQLSVSTETGLWMANGPSPWYRGVPNTWVHVALVLEYEGKLNDRINVRFIVNGDLQYHSPTFFSSRRSDAPGSGMCSSSKVGSVSIGVPMTNTPEESRKADPYNFNRQWTKPILDEFRIWTTSRSKQQIRDSMYRRLEENELEARNLEIDPQVPQCFVYLPFNSLDRRDQDLGKDGTHWATIQNQAHILDSAMLGSNPQGRRESMIRFSTYNPYEPFSTPNGIVVDEMSSAPVSGWEQEVVVPANQKTMIQLGGAVVPRAPDINSCPLQTFKECLKNDPGVVEGVFRRGGEDLVYPPVKPIRSIPNSEQSNMVYVLKSITFSDGYSGTFFVDNTQVASGSSGDASIITTDIEFSMDQEFAFRPGSNLYSLEPPVGFSFDEALSVFATVRYQVRDNRNLGLDVPSTQDSMEAVLHIRVKRQDVPVVGKVGNALRCNGGTGTKTRPQWAVADLQINLAQGQHTIELWFLGIQHTKELLFTDVLLGGEVFSMGKGIEGGNPEFRFSHKMYATGLLGMFADSRQLGFGLEAQPLYQWTHLAMVVDNSNVEEDKANVLIYVNGELESSGQVEVYKDSNIKSTILRGLHLCGGLGDVTDPRTVVNGWEGFVDEVRLWKVARTQQEIRSQMFSELDLTPDAGNIQKLNGYWTFEDESDEIALDLSQNGHHLIMGNCDPELLRTPRQSVMCHRTIGMTTNGNIRLVKSDAERPRVESPIVDSPVRKFQSVELVRVPPGEETVFRPIFLNPNRLPCGTTSSVSCAYHDLDAIQFIELANIPPDNLALMYAGINGTLISKSGQKIPISTGIDIKPLVQGSQTSFSYRIFDGDVSSALQTVTLQLTCPAGNRLHKGNCERCPSGMYLQPSLETECCDIQVPHSGCFRCPLKTSPSISSEGDLVCSCLASKEQFKPIPLSLVSKTVVDCLVCGVNDYEAAIQDCDASSHLRPVIVNRTNLDCPESVNAQGVPCAFVVPTSWAGYMAATVAIVGFTINFGFLIWIWRNRMEDVMRFSQPLFCGLFCFGAAVMNLSTLSLIGENSDALCTIRVWCINLSFTIMFSALFVKVWRVWKLFYNYRLKALRLSDRMLGLIMAQVVFVDLVLLLLWYFVDPLKATTVPVQLGIDATPRNSFSEVICKSEGEVFSTLAVSYKLVILLFGLRLSYETRKVDGRFSESAYIALAVLYMFSLGGLTFLTTALLDLTPVARVTLQCVGVMLCTTVSVALVILPKILAKRRALNFANENDMFDSSAHAAKDPMLFGVRGTNNFAGQGGHCCKEQYPCDHELADALRSANGEVSHSVRRLEVLNATPESTPITRENVSNITPLPSTRSSVTSRRNNTTSRSEVETDSAVVVATIGNSFVVTREGDAKMTFQDVDKVL